MLARFLIHAVTPLSLFAPVQKTQVSSTRRLVFRETCLLGRKTWRGSYESEGIARAFTAEIQIAQLSAASRQRPHATTSTSPKFPDRPDVLANLFKRGHSVRFAQSPNDRLFAPFRVQAANCRRVVFQ